jgi:hypothetical protein
MVHSTPGSGSRVELQFPSAEQRFTCRIEVMKEHVSSSSTITFYSRKAGKLIDAQPDFTGRWAVSVQGRGWLTASNRMWC